MEDKFMRVRLAFSHVRDGQERIERQKALIARLRKRGHAALIPEAETILAWMESVQLMFEERFAEAKEKATLPNELDLYRDLWSSPARPKMPGFEGLKRLL